MMGYFASRFFYELQKSVFVFVTSAVLIFILFNNSYGKTSIQYDNIQPLKRFSSDMSDLENHKNVVDTYYAARKYWKTSNLGTILFKNADSALFVHEDRLNKTFKVLIWRYWPWLHKRHVQNFKNLTYSNILRDCSVKNCVFTGDNKQLPKSDAVVVHVQKGVFPNIGYKRNRKQRWIFLSDESPRNTFSLANYFRSYLHLYEYANVFNWTMTYRSDADVPVPYGRTIPLHAPIIVNSLNSYLILEALVPYWRFKNRLEHTAILISNCKNHGRNSILNEFKFHINVDIYGECGHKLKMACPGYYKKDCELLRNYKFYLALENGMCRQYITEKVFWNAYSNGAIPVIVGPPLEDCLKLLPPNSFLHIDNFTSIEQLAIHMEQLVSNYDELLFYHKWRMHFKIVNEHGYFGTKSYHYCRICEALNYNDGQASTYRTDDLRLYFDPRILCTIYKNHNASDVSDTDTDDTNQAELI